MFALLLKFNFISLISDAQFMIFSLYVRLSQYNLTSNCNVFPYQTSPICLFFTWFLSVCDSLYFLTFRGTSLKARWFVLFFHWLVQRREVHFAVGMLSVRVWFLYIICLYTCLQYVHKNYHFMLVLPQVVWKLVVNNLVFSFKHNAVLVFVWYFLNIIVSYFIWCVYF